MTSPRSTLPGNLSEALGDLGPNWFAAVMGTGIVANAAILLPHGGAALRSFALAVWLLAAALLAALLAATASRWIARPGAARAHALDPAMAPFYGAPPMAFLTVGAGTLLVGRDLVGLHAAVLADAVLWGVGTVTGLLACVAIPVLMFTRHELTPERTFGTWLMPVVPPMVSAATGAVLIPHLPGQQLQLTMLIACYAMFGMSLVVSLTTVALLWSRLAYHKLGPPETIPTLWIVLGPMGQSVTAAGLLGAQASGAIAEPYATGMRAMGVLYGIPIWGFAMLWLAIVAVVTLGAARRHLPFALTWWSFTFPVGTVVTGTSVLAAQTGSDVVGWLAVALYALLLGAWATAFANTARWAWTGRPLPAPRRAPALIATPERA